MAAIAAFKLRVELRNELPEAHLSRIAIAASQHAYSYLGALRQA